MHKKKFSEEQQGLVALLPQGLPKLTDGAKLVLANVILWYGTDSSQKSGIMFRTNKDMMKDCEIGSESTIIKATKQLEMLGLLTTKRGKRGEASEYRLSEEMQNKINFKIIDKNNVNNMNNESAVITPQSAVITPQSEVITPQSEVINDLRLIVSELQSAVIILQSAVMELKEVLKCSNNSSKCSTDTDTESEKDIEKEKDINKEKLKHEAEVATGEVTQVDEVCTLIDDISVEVDTPSGIKQSSSFNFEEDLASAHEDSFSSLNFEKESRNALQTASAHKSISTEGTTRDNDNLISMDGIEHLPWEVSEEVKPISTVTSTDGKADTVSAVQNDTISTADRLTYPQCLDNALTPRVPLPPLSHVKQETNPQVEDFLKRVKSAIHKGVYDWSLTLDDMPDFLTGDEINSVVAPALRSQADVNDYLGKFRLQVLNDYAHELMENRLKNKDINSIIRHNRIEKKRRNGSGDD